MDAAAWDARYAGTELVWTAEPNRFVVEEVAPLTPALALDLACGEGRNAVWLAERGWVVTAVDFSQVALDKGRSLAEHQGVEVTWVRADVVTWRPRPASFDLVLLSYLHLPSYERRRVLDAAVGAIALGGRLVVVGHDRANMTHGIGGPQDPTILLDTDELLADLAVGPALGIERAGPVRRPVTKDGEQRFAIDTVVTAVRPNTP